MSTVADGFPPDAVGGGGNRAFVPPDPAGPRPPILSDSLRLPTPRQPTPEVRAGRAYRNFSGIFLVLLTAAIGLFTASLFLPPRFHWPLWVAAAAVILLTAPLRTWGLRRGLLSYYVHGIAVDGTVTAVAPAGIGVWLVTYRFESSGAGAIEAETTIYDSPEAPLAVGAAVEVLHRPDFPRDSVLPRWAGIL